MKSIPRSKTLAATLAAGVLSVGVMVPALAQEGDTDQESTTDESTTPEDRHTERDREFAAALAAELGLDESAVAAAIETVREQLEDERDAERRAALEERLDEAVEAGDLTQEQADALLAAEEAGVRGFGGGRHGGHGPHGFGRGPAGNPSAEQVAPTAA